MSIKGIGPSIERTLHDLGIRRFHQIAEMSEFDIDRVAQQLRGFRSRIYREDWIGQARDLDNRKNGDSP
jgi:predicted flap endonuclease-1-like 5' DNA nuclease